MQGQLPSIVAQMGFQLQVEHGRRRFSFFTVIIPT